MVKEHHCRKNKMLPGSHLFPSSSLMLPAPRCLLSSGHCRPLTYIPMSPLDFLWGCSFPIGQSSCPTRPLEAPVCHVTPNSSFKILRQYHTHLEPFQLPQSLALHHDVTTLCRYLNILTVITCLSNLRGPQSLVPTIYLISTQSPTHS